MGTYSVRPDMVWIQTVFQFYSLNKKVTQQPTCSIMHTDEAVYVL